MSLTKHIRSLTLAMTMASAVVGALPGVSVPVSVKAELDSATLLMGYTTRLRLSVEQPAGAKVDFPLLRDAAGRSYIGLAGDSVEISPAVKLDTARLQNGRIRVDYNLTVQAFDSGLYKLPPFELICDGEVVRSNPLTLQVNPVKVPDDAAITGFTDIEEPLDATEDDMDRNPFTRWLAKYWWLLLILLVLAAFIVWAWRRWRTKGTLLPVKPQIPPYDEACEGLRKLKSRKLWEKNKEKEYFTGLTFILRRYLSKEFGIPALEMTSRQIMAALKDDADLAAQRDRLRRLLDMADFVKYAKVRPLPEDNEAAFVDTESIIRDAHAVYLERQAAAAAETASKTDNGPHAKKGKVGDRRKIKVGGKNRRNKNKRI